MSRLYKPGKFLHNGTPDQPKDFPELCKAQLRRLHYCLYVNATLVHELREISVEAPLVLKGQVNIYAQEKKLEKKRSFMPIHCVFVEENHLTQVLLNMTNFTT